MISIFYCSQTSNLLIIIIYFENILNNQKLMHVGNADSIDAREEI